MVWGYLLAFGIVSLLIGMVMFTGAFIWKANTSAEVWTSGMIWLLAIGTFLILLGALLIGFGIGYYEPDVILPTAPVVVRDRPVILEPVKQPIDLVEDPITGSYLTKNEFRSNCRSMKPPILKSAYQNYEIYKDYCGDIYQLRR